MGGEIRNRDWPREEAEEGGECSCWWGRRTRAAEWRPAEEQPLEESANELWLADWVAGGERHRAERWPWLPSEERPGEGDDEEEDELSWLPIGGVLWRRRNQQKQWDCQNIGETGNWGNCIGFTFWW